MVIYEEYVQCFVQASIGVFGNLSFIILNPLQWISISFEKLGSLMRTLEISLFLEAAQLAAVIAEKKVQEFYSICIMSFLVGFLAFSHYVVDALRIFFQGIQENCGSETYLCFH